jgi:hypothetical protein
MLLLVIHEIPLYGMDLVKNISATDKSPKHHNHDYIDYILGYLCDNSHFLHYQYTTQLLHTLCCVNKTIEAKIKETNDMRKKTLLDIVEYTFGSNPKFAKETLVFNRFNTACGWKHKMCKEHLMLGPCECLEDNTTMEKAAEFRAQLTSRQWTHTLQHTIKDEKKHPHHIWKEEQNIEVYKAFIPSPYLKTICDEKIKLGQLHAIKPDWDGVYTPNNGSNQFTSPLFFNKYDDLAYYSIYTDYGHDCGSYEHTFDRHGKFRTYNAYFSIDGIEQHTLACISRLKHFFDYITQIRQKTHYTSRQVISQQLIDSKAIIDARDIVKQFSLSDFGLQIISMIIPEAPQNISKELLLPVAYVYHIGGNSTNARYWLDHYNSDHAKSFHLYGDIHLWKRPFGGLFPQEKWSSEQWGNMLGGERDSSETGLEKYFYEECSIDTVHDNMTKQQQQLYSTVIVPPTMIREPEYFVDINTTIDQKTNIYLWKNNHHFRFHYSISGRYRHDKALRNITHAVPFNDGINLAIVSDTTLYILEPLPNNKDNDDKSEIIQGAHQPTSTVTATIPLLTEQETNQGVVIEDIEWPNQTKPIIAYLRPTTWIERLLKEPIKTIDPISSTVNVTWRFYKPLHTLSMLYSLCKSVFTYLHSAG